MVCLLSESTDLRADPYVRKEAILHGGRLFIDVSLMEKTTKLMHDHFARISLEIVVCKGMCEADSDCTHASFRQRRQFCLSSRSSPTVTVVLSFCSAAFLDTSFHCETD